MAKRALTKGAGDGSGKKRRVEPETVYFYNGVQKPTLPEPPFERITDWQWAQFSGIEKSGRKPDPFQSIKLPDSLVPHLPSWRDMLAINDASDQTSKLLKLMNRTRDKAEALAILDAFAMTPSAEREFLASDATSQHEFASAFSTFYTVIGWKRSFTLYWIGAPDGDFVQCAELARMVDSIEAPRAPTLVTWNLSAACSVQRKRQGADARPVRIIALNYIPDIEPNGTYHRSAEVGFVPIDMIETSKHAMQRGHECAAILAPGYRFRYRDAEVFEAAYIDVETGSAEGPVLFEVLHYDVENDEGEIPGMPLQRSDFKGNWFSQRNSYYAPRSLTPYFFIETPRKLSNDSRWLTQMFVPFGIQMGGLFPSKDQIETMRHFLDDYAGGAPTELSAEYVADYDGEWLETINNYVEDPADINAAFWRGAPRPLGRKQNITDEFMNAFTECAMPLPLQDRWRLYCVPRPQKDFARLLNMLEHSKKTGQPFHTSVPLFTTWHPNVAANFAADGEGDEHYIIVIDNYRRVDAPDVSVVVPAYLDIEQASRRSHHCEVILPPGMWLEFKSNLSTNPTKESFHYLRTNDPELEEDDDNPRTGRELYDTFHIIYANVVTPPPPNLARVDLSGRFLCVHCPGDVVASHVRADGFGATCERCLADHTS